MAAVYESASCGCGHELTLHDRNGCAAFLGAFAETAWIKRYCACRTPRIAPLQLFHRPARARRDQDVIATIRVRERAGAAIAVSEFPPALELGASAALVIERVKERLRRVVEPPASGSAQLLMIVREESGETRIEALR